MQEAINTLSWEELSTFQVKEESFVNGPNAPYASMRLFGQEEKDIRVTLYRDNHAWCPYCQKIWLWLEWKRIPYLIKKATMRCYGQKEKWFLEKVPSGMFPAIELDQTVITESDRILLSLEDVFGPLGMPLSSECTLSYRRLERRLFIAWCNWLCRRPSVFNQKESNKQREFTLIAEELNEYLSKNTAPWLDSTSNNQGESIPGSADVVFIPYLERMNASLAYYKGFDLRKEFLYIDRWFRALENSETYRGTQGDFHTHAHDLPPQMGGCWAHNSSKQEEFSQKIDSGEGLGKLETSYEDSSITPERIALGRVLKHRGPIMNSNPLREDLFDQPLRAALSTMITGKLFAPKKGSARGLRYLRDRVSVPRDMPLLSARRFRQALEKTASLDGPEQAESIPTKHRFDQDPKPFQKQ